MSNTHTEEEARGKWCPMNRVSYDSQSGTLSNTLGGSIMCAASNCMAWRWSRETETRAYLADVQAHMKAEADAGKKASFATSSNAVWAEKAGTYARNEGYCGLAGKGD